MADYGADRKTSSAIASMTAEIKQEMKNQEAGAKMGHNPKPGKGSKNSNLKAEAFRTMDEHKIPMEELLTRLKSDQANGMEEATANKRLEEDGFNVLTEKEGLPWYCLFLKEMTGLFSLLLWFGSLLCFIGYGLDSSDPANLYLGIVLAAVVFITGCFSYYQESKSAAIMAGFKNFVPPKCKVIRSGKNQEIPASNLVRGDVVVINMGDRIPADIRILFSDDMKVDNSSLTGEADLLERNIECTNENALETENLAFFGTLCKEGTGKGIVIKTGDQTVMGQIAYTAQSEESDDTPLNKEIKRFIKIISSVAFFLGITFFIFGIIFGYGVITNLVFAIGIIVANVPEGLLATVTVSLSLTAKRMAKKYVLVKNLEAVETLGSTSCICSDKTGTLTQNKMTVAHLWYNGELVEAPEWSKAAEDERKLPYKRTDATFAVLHRCAICCNVADFDDSIPSERLEGKTDAEKEKVIAAHKEELANTDWNHRKTVGDASESALIKFYRYMEDLKDTRTNTPIIQNEDKGFVARIPFNSQNKFAASIHKDNGKTVLFMKGAPERVWQRCTHVLSNGSSQPITDEWRKKYDEANNTLGQRGERVLGFAYTEIPQSEVPKDNVFELKPPKGKTDIPILQRPLTFCGLIALQDPPRVGVKEAVDTCRSAGIKVIMVTGDQPVTAASIARQVRIITKKTYDELIEENPYMSKAQALEKADAIVVHGDTLAHLIASEEDLPEEEQGKILEMWLRKDEIVFSRTSPAQKLQIVKGCQALGRIVAVTGDGVNDSPAIKKADIGIAMGIGGSDVSKDVADMILLNDDFTSIVNGVEEGRLIFDNLKKSIAYTLSSNIPEIAPFLCFILIQIPLPLSTVLILCVDLGTDMIPAISLAYENPELDIMQRKPRNAKVDHLVTTRLISFSYLQIGVIQALAGFYTYFVVMYDYGFKPSELVQFALKEGVEPDEDDVFNPSVVGKGNRNWNTAPGADNEDDTVNWNTTEHAELDLRMWFADKSDDDWAECRTDDESSVSDESVCYTTEALRYAQCAYFVSIVCVQWADLLICKTRKLSIAQQGMKNMIMNFGLCSETVLALILCYVEPLNLPLGTRPLNSWHFAIPAGGNVKNVGTYDEIRKMLIRDHVKKYGKPGFVEKNTYY
eukprot:CAMPEP_0115014404 /NCGR_PEP_ID=MMETSP0216-20121206/26055_1 /TAXON_ID=223996 /ORGANISM="Protocruzia adherens, Strain Boccale" /LENGTH=1142 /DNA_ID=CAMNT_0002384131 /DNA_START=450 /DNA_END=3878 /DNA_ORIENTATION=-